MNLDDNNLDKLLGDHLGRELSSQAGRAETAFRNSIRLPQPERASWHLPLWLAGGLAAAAAVALSFWVFKPAPPSPTRSTVQNPSPIATAASTDRDLEYTTYTRTLDEGLVYLDDQTPVHQLRRQEVQQVRWLDADGKTQTKLTVPKEEVYLIEYMKN